MNLSKNIAPAVTGLTMHGGEMGPHWRCRNPQCKLVNLISRERCGRCKGPKPNLHTAGAEEAGYGPLRSLVHESAG